MKAVAEKTEAYADPHEPLAAQNRISQDLEPQALEPQESSSVILEFPTKANHERGKLRGLLAKWFYPTGFLGI